jgi:hypothetical protein
LRICCLQTPALPCGDHRRQLPGHAPPPTHAPEGGGGPQQSRRRLQPSVDCPGAHPRPRCKENLYKHTHTHTHTLDIVYMHTYIIRTHTHTHTHTHIHRTFAVDAGRVRRAARSRDDAPPPQQRAGNGDGPGAVLILVAPSAQEHACAKHVGIAPHKQLAVLCDDRGAPRPCAGHDSPTRRVGATSCQKSIASSPSPHALSTAGTNFRYRREPCFAIIMNFF